MTTASRYPDREAALDELRAVVRDASRLNRLHAILDGDAALPVVLERALLALSELFAADIVVLARPGPDGLIPVASVGLPDEGAGVVLGSSPGTAAAQALAGRQPVLVADAIADPGLAPVLAGLGVHALVWLPLLGSSPGLGLVVLARCRAYPFARSDVDLLAPISRRLAMVIERSEADEERRRLEALRGRTEKAESLARVASAVAHHFNNKLTAVMGFLELAELDLPPGSPVARDLRSARDAAREAGHVGHLLLDYLGREFEPREPVDLVALVREAVAAVRPGLPPGVEVALDLPPTPLVVAAAPRQAHEILDHLLANAREAVEPAGGRIRVHACELGTLDGPRACIEVADDGPGIAPEVVPVAFEPFVSTKATGRGLGLAAVMGMVRAHGGSVTLHSEPGRGTAVRVLLPLADPGTPPA